MTNQPNARKDIVAVCARLYERKLIAGLEGNVSIRLGTDRILITPAGVNKGFLKEDMLVETDLAGQVIGTGVPSGEIHIHKAVYQHQSSARAVVHAHPTHCVALSLAGISLEEPIIPELVATMGSIPTVPYATPQSEALAKVIAASLRKDIKALILERHGSITMGDNVFEAFDRLDMIEHAACIIWKAKTLSDAPIPRLSSEEIQRLKQ